MLGDSRLERAGVLGVLSSWNPSFRGLSTLLVVAMSVLVGTVKVLVGTVRVCGDGNGECGSAFGRTLVWG